MAKFFSWLVAYWYLMVPLVLGFVAIVTLLPHSGKRRVPVQAGLAASIVALLLTGLLLIRSSNDLALDLFFYVFAAVALASAGAVIVQKNPVYSALYFAITVLGVCGLFLIKNASFLAAATIIVYAGAIIVTFLFVIMLAQQSGLADYDRRSRERVFSCLAGFVLLAAILFIVEKNFPQADVAPVAAVLQEAASVTAPDRYLRTGREILELLQVKGKPAEMEMQTMYERLNAWPEMPAQKAEATKAWAQVRKQLQDEKVVQSHVTLNRLAQLAVNIEEAHNRYGGVLGNVSGPRAITSQLSKKNGDRRADVVNELGRSLFGDYLYAVELAGTLLLVATIAAILIAQESERRKKVTA